MSSTVVMADDRDGRQLPVTSPPPAQGLVVSGWSVASPLGMGAAPFAAGIRAGRSGVVALDRARWTGPVDHAGLVPDFSVAGALGPKGTRSMDRAAGLAVAAVGMLLRQEHDVVASAEGEVGLVLGTSTGSAESIMAFTADSLTQEKPFYVDPSRFPSTVMNYAAGQCAIWHGLKGPNTTVAGGNVTGLLALNYASRLQRCGHVDTILCGAVEEFSVQRSWLDWHSRSADSVGSPPGEGCAVVILEPAVTARRHGRRGLAEILAVEFGAWNADHGPREIATRCIRRAFERSGVDTGDVWAVASSGRRGPLGAGEEAAISDVLGGSAPVSVPSLDLLGDTAAASSTFQLVALLATAQDTPEARGRAALVTSIDRDGLVGCALLLIGA